MMWHFIGAVVMTAILFAAVYIVARALRVILDVSDARRQLRDTARRIRDMQGKW